MIRTDESVGPSECNTIIDCTASTIMKSEKSYDGHKGLHERLIKELYVSCSPSVTNQFTTKVMEMKLRDWDFDQHSYISTDLARFAAIILVKKKVDQFLGISVKNMGHFCKELERNFNHRNPYHNFKHAFMVLHVTDRLLSRMDAKNNNKKQLNDVHRAGLLLAAICHDIFYEFWRPKKQDKHRSKKKVVYVESNPIHMNAAKTLSTLKRMHLFDALQAEERDKLEKLMIILIMDTDITRQSQLLAECQHLKIPKGRRGKSTTQDLYCRLLIHCADMSYVTMTHGISQYWTNLIFEEFQLLSPETAAQKGSANEARRQYDYIVSFVKPPWKVLKKVMPKESIEYPFLNIDANARFWKRCWRG